VGDDVGLIGCCPGERPADRAFAPWLEIIVPARNEQSRLPAGLAKLAAKAATLPPGVSIIVVDNASSDATASVARDWPEGPVPVRLLSCDRPGKGAAVRAGLLATRAPYVGFCDADMASDLSALDTAIELLLSGKQLVIASRADPRSDVQDRHSAVRRAGAVAFRACARAVVPGVTDTQCGFKFFAGPVARAAAASLRSTGFAFDIELIARCRRLGAEPVEIPVTWRDVPGSSFSVWRHSVASFAGVAGIWLSMRRHRASPAGHAASWQPTLLDAVAELGGAQLGRARAAASPAHRRSS
jgi:dolichyl-phosphate beta-glucosyltransferase